MKYLLIILSALVPATGFAADPVTYYRADEALARKIAAEKTASIADADTRAVRENSVIEAFGELFRTAQVKESDVQKITLLLAERDILADSLSRVRAAITAKEAALNDTTVAEEDPLVTQKRNDIAHLRSRIEKLRAELDLAEIAMRTDSVKLAATRAQADSISREVAGLQAENERNAKNDDVRKTIDDERIIEEIRTAMIIPAGELNAWDIKAYRAAAADFTTTSARIAATRGADSKTIADSVAAYDTEVVPAAEAMKKALAVMAGKYSDDDAAAIAAEMEKVRSAAAKGKILKPHKAEIDKVADAAADYNRAWRNLNFLLGHLRGITAAPPEGFDIHEFIGSVVGIYSPGATRYPDYYEKFNQALDYIIRNYRPNMSEAEANEFFDRINAEITK